MALTNLICNFAKILITNYIYYEILKNYESVTLKICNLEVELQKQKAIKEVFENGDTEGYLLNKDYSHVNIPLMELSENSTDKTYDSPSPKMLIKE